MLVGYGVFAAYFFGFVMNLWFWPYAVGPGTDVSFVAGDPMLENLQRYVVFTFTTSSLGWDTGRAVTNALAILALGPAVLATLRRASFGVAVTFAPTPTDAGGLPRYRGSQLGTEANPGR